MNIKGRKTILRAIEVEDLARLQKWANDPVTQDGIGELHFPGSMAFHRAWLEKVKDDQLNQRFVVDVPDIGIIGISTIINIDWRNRHAWHGLVLGEASHRGKGFGIDAVMATMRFVFEELNLERLDGSMIQYNEASIAMYCGKLGWKEEGRRRNYYFRKARYWDQVLVGITKQDYIELLERTNYWDSVAADKDK